MHQENVTECVEKTEIYHLPVEKVERQNQFRVHLRHLDPKPRPGTIAVVVPEMLQGWYQGANPVHAANYRSFLKMFGEHSDIIELWGDFGAYGVAIHATCTEKEIMSVLCGLTDYPVIDDTMLLEVEEGPQWFCRSLDTAEKDGIRYGYIRAHSPEEAALAWARECLTDDPLGEDQQYSVWTLEDGQCLHYMITDELVEDDDDCECSRYESCSCERQLEAELYESSTPYLLRPLGGRHRLYEVTRQPDVASAVKQVVSYSRPRERHSQEYLVWTGVLEEQWHEGLKPDYRAVVDAAGAMTIREA